jgi:DNA-binding ferritin-like protein
MSAKESLRREAGTVEENAVRIDTAKTEQVIEVELVREHVSLAEGLGDYATDEILRDTLEDLEDDAHEIDHFLEDDTLVLEEALN